MPSTVSDGGTSTLTIALADNETFGIQALGSTYQFTLSGTGTFSNGGVSSAGDFSGFGTGTLVLQASGIARYGIIHITDANTTAAATTTNVDLIESGTNSYSTSIKVTMNNSPFASAVQIRQTRFTGAAGLDVTSTGGVELLTGGITTVDGAVSLAGNTAGSFAGDLNAVEVQSPITSSAGAITLAGIGGTGTGADNNDGVRIINGGAVHSGSGAVTITGTGGGASISAGVIIENTIPDPGTAITSATGDITITGTGSATSSGVVISNNVTVQSTGTGVDAATITIDGTSLGNVAVRIDSTDTLVTSADGDISIIGNTQATNVGFPGVYILNSAVISSTGTGVDAATITIDGTAAGSSNGGVAFYNGVRVTSVDGPISLTGHATGGGGVVIDSSDIHATGAADITITGTDTGGSGNGDSDGVRFQNTGIEVTAAGGDILIEGTASGDDGLQLAPSNLAPISTTGAGSITLKGTSTAGGTLGVGVLASLIAVATEDGDILVDGTSSSSTATLFSVGGMVQATGDGQILVNATDGPLSAGGNISTAAGPIVLTAFDSAAARNNVSVGGAVSSSGNSVTIHAGDSFLMALSGSINTPSGDLEVVVDFGDADPGTGTSNSVSGVLQGGSTAQFVGGPDNDAFTFFLSAQAAAPSSTNYSVAGGAGDDAFTINPTKTTGPVDVIESPGQGSDRVQINSTGPAADSYAVSGSQTTFGSAAVGHANIETLIINAGPGDDTISVTPSTTVAITINGVTHDSATPGDTLNFQVPAGQTASAAENGDGSGVIHATGGYLDVTYSGIETLVVPPPGGSSPKVVSFFVLYGGLVLSYDLLASPTRVLPWQVTGIRALFSEPVNATAGSLSFTGTGAPTVSGVSGSGTDTVTWAFTTPVSEADLTAILASGGITAAAGGSPLDGDPNNPGPDPFSQALDVLYGDVDGDRFVNSRDASLVLARTRGQAVAVPDQFLDVNGDGVVDSADLAIVRGRSGRRL